MKLLISMLLVLMTFNTYAVAPFADEFRLAIDEFHYGVNVVWDQKDLSIRNELTTNLIEKIKELRAQGASLNDFQEVLQEMNHGNVANKDLEILLASQNFKNDEAIVNFIFNKSNLSYHAGASWNGAVISTSAFVVGAVLIAIWATYRTLNHVPESGGGHKWRDTDIKNAGKPK